MAAPAATECFRHYVPPSHNVCATCKTATPNTLLFVCRTGKHFICPDCIADRAEVADPDSLNESASLKFVVMQHLVCGACDQARQDRAHAEQRRQQMLDMARDY